MTQTENLVKRLPNDIGGLPAEPSSAMTTSWSLGKSAATRSPTCSIHKIINTEEKRCGVEALGAEMVGELSYYERWIVAFANMLFRKGILTPPSWRGKKEIEARWAEAHPDHHDRAGH